LHVQNTNDGRSQPRPSRNPDVFDLEFSSRRPTAAISSEDAEKQWANVVATKLAMKNKGSDAFDKKFASRVSSREVCVKATEIEASAGGERDATCGTPIRPRVRGEVGVVTDKESRNRPGWERSPSQEEAAYFESLSEQVSQEDPDGVERINRHYEDFISTFELNRQDRDIDRGLEDEPKGLPDQQDFDINHYLNAPSYLMRRIVFFQSDRKEWMLRVAQIRSRRIVVIIMQMYLRHLALTDTDLRKLYLQKLPRGAWRRTLIEVVTKSGYSRQDLQNMVYILAGRHDQQRFERFLEVKTYKPIFLLQFIIRPTAELTNVKSLADLIDHCFNTYHGVRGFKSGDVTPYRNPGRSVLPMLNMNPKGFAFLIQLLAKKCYQVDSRMLIKLSNLVARYLDKMTDWDLHPTRIYIDRCFVFNEALRLLSPEIERKPPRAYNHLSYVWEAQRTLLSMSASFKRPLQVQRAGFRAVRQVLAGLEKNPVEIHNSMRHAQTWPPYLKPGDGIDEMMEPEDNWSRSVQAGALQQEAGFAKDELDDAMDTLQGRTPNGTPTIQQRLARPIAKNYTLWEASIRATRNAEEAWARFQMPPRPGMQPRVYEYAAMFAKLYEREVESDSSLRPGDKALSFPVKRQNNLSEAELLRVEPPSPAQLYERMRQQGIEPSGSCLGILVRNAPTIVDAHQYLLASPETTWALTSWRMRQATSEEVNEVRMPIFASYLQLCARIGGKYTRHLIRAIRFCRLRFAVDTLENRRWAPFIWGLILKELTSNRFGERQSLDTQLSLYLEVLDGMVRPGTTVELSTLIQYAKSLKKAARKHLDSMIGDLEKGVPENKWPLWLLYDPEARQEMAAKAEQRRKRAMGQGKADEHKPTTVELLCHGSDILKQLCVDSVDNETEVQDILKDHKVDSVDIILARTDPVRADYAYDLMLAFAFLGEYSQMAVFLQWLVKQWSDPELAEDLRRRKVRPEYTDFEKVLCAYRMLAEPMLDEERVSSVQQLVENSELDWIWPDEDMLEAYADSEADQAVRKLAHLQEWIRFRQAQRRDGTGEEEESRN
jgi:hypothetical protein